MELTLSLKRPLVIGLVLILLSLNWLALHDIFNGERDLFNEYAFVLASVSVLGALIVRKQKI